MDLSIDEARKIVLQQQLLNDFEGSASDAIEHLGYIQIDTIYVVERAHNHVLWSRNPDFTPNQLDELHRKKKTIYEYWAHAMSYLPVKDFRFSLPVMKHFRDREDCREILSVNKKLVKEIRTRISSEGSLSASDFASPKNFSGGGWWNRKPAKQVLEALYWQGELLISHRQNFKRFYDLSERVLNLSQKDLIEPTTQEVFQHHLTRVLRTLGVASKADLTWFVKDKKAAVKVLHEMIEVGEVLITKLEGFEEPYYILKNVVQNLKPFSKSNQIKILSPFDNMVIRRDFIKRLFNFNFVFECYVPEPKRQFGYFSCPLLSGSELIGTLDGKAERTTGEFIVKNFHLFETNQGCNKPPYEAISQGIKSFARFNRCDKIKLECQRKQTKPLGRMLK